jgi:pyruvate/2-oxoglutarate dehydrogenase complex dihydrolipoamide acyltransferase (E2) component
MTSEAPEAPPEEETPVEENGEEEAPPEAEDLGEGWLLVHDSPEEIVVLSDTQGRAQVTPALLRAEKEINGQLVSVEAPTRELLEERIDSINEAQDALAEIEVEPAPLEEAPTTAVQMQVVEGETDPQPEEIEINPNTVITNEGSFTDAEWSARHRRDTVVLDEGQVVYSGVGDQVEEIDADLAATAAATTEAEQEATTDPHAGVETKQILVDTSDAIDSPGQSAGGTLVIAADAEDAAEAAASMALLSAEAENERVVGAEEEEEGTDSGDEEDAPADEPEATPAAQAAAEELGVDLSEVSGTGTDGKITKSDVEAHADSSA